MVKYLSIVLNLTSFVEFIMSGFQVLPLVSQAPAHRLVSKVLVHSCATSLIGSSPLMPLCPGLLIFCIFPVMILVLLSVVQRKIFLLDVNGFLI